MSAACTTPVPTSDAFCGLFGASSVTLSVPVTLPSAVGVNVMLIVQFLPAAKVDPQVVADTAKGGVAAMLLMVSVPVTAFVKVTVFAALVSSTAWLPKFNEVGDTLGGGFTINCTESSEFENVVVSEGLHSTDRFCGPMPSTVPLVGMYAGVPGTGDEASSCVALNGVPNVMLAGLVHWIAGIAGHVPKHWPDKL